jgi:cyclophilin family peptidyl-prolyl cis-trans isomerase
MRQPGLPTVFVVILVSLILIGLFYSRTHQNDLLISAIPSPLASTEMGTSPSPTSSPSILPSPTSNPNPDLTVDAANGLSRATVTLATSQGVIKFKFYSQDAPNTVKRIVELIQKGFYNGLIFHRVVPGFVVQGGDPLGNGTGGSGQKLKAEFNSRRHIEGAVAMARAGDPDSADSQFYISLGTSPHLDHSYTVFGQVIEGMDVTRKLKVGDKMNSVVVD